MNRRKVLQTMGGIATMGMTQGFDSNHGNAIAAAHSQSSQAFSKSFNHFKPLLGPTEVRFNNRLPPELSGTLYRNGPARMQRGSMQYHHWFDGDGMMQSFRLHGDTLTHQGKVIYTDKYKAEEKKDKFLWSSFGTTVPDAQIPQKPDDVNVANISVLPMGDELLALWEAGSAWRIDPETLETLGRKVFSDQTNGLPFSAHPRVDTDGRIWNFGYMSGMDQLLMYELEPSGALKRTAIIESPKTNMVHDFAMTDKYLIFALMPIEFTIPSGAGFPSFLSMLSWDENSSVDILVIDKETLSVVNRIEMPPFFAFHFGNAWQDGDQLRIETAKATGFDALMQEIENATLGKKVIVESSQPNAIDIIVNINNGTVSTETLPFIGGDFPCFDERYAGSNTNSLIMLQRSKDMPDDVIGFNTVAAMNRKAEQMASFSYGSTVIAEEHVFVPKPQGKESDGWLIGTAYDWQSERTMLSVFDTGFISDGPIATATLPYGLPIGLHGKYVSDND